jgi:hypothetical protein
MSIFIKIILTLIIIGVGYFALVRVWTSEIDILSLLKKPSESIPIRESAVAVVPDELNLTTSDWNKTELIEIRNAKAKDTLYSVWIKIKAQTPDSDLTDIEVLSETGQEFISESLGGGISVNFEAVKITAFDADRQPCICLLIYRIRALESRVFKIKRKGSKQDTKKPLILVLKVIGFSDKPAPIASKDNAAALQFVPPESLTIKAITFLMKKEP